MSMSSLSAQLASLNGGASSKNAGSSLSTSRRHEDTIGRGISHSAKHGHSISGGAGAKHKPSVLYADSKSASDVPLTTLRENCVSSLRQLAKLTGNDDFVSSKFLQTLAGVHSLQFERGLATASENDKMDVLIGDLLALLSTAMGESSSTSSTTSCFSSSLHGLEYLLRRYDIHLRETCAELFVRSVLPFHQEPLFARVLQLVDLASLPTFAHLRPFAAQGAPPPSRTILAKRASKDDALIRVYCEMAKSAADICATESSNGVPRRGISRIISFAAAVLLEALSVQTTNVKFHGSISESTLRVILPFVLSACCDSSLDYYCRDWRGFGHVMASCIAEKCVLSMEARETLATSIVKGAAFHDEHVELRVELVADCIATLMAVLSVSPKASNQENNSKLAMLPSHNNNGDTPRTLGYILPVATYKQLIKLDTLAEAVGHLYSDRNLVVAPLVASIVAIASSRVSTDSKSVGIILSLIQQDQLEPLWKDRFLNLTASVAAVVLSLVTSLDHCTNETAEDIQTIIEALKNACPTACDAGIARALTKIPKNDEKDVRPVLLKILGLDELTATEDMDVDLEDVTPLMLPPRVALEHADASVRLSAIKRLARESSSVESGGESLEQALLRHFLTEDELNVAVAAGEALAGLLDSGSSFVTLAFANDCLEALNKWTLDEDTLLAGTVQDDESKTKKKRHKKKSSEEEKMGSRIPQERVRALEVALEVAGHSVLTLGTTSHQDNVELIQQQLLQGIIAHLDVMEAQAGRVLLKALGRSEKAKKNAKNLLLTTEMLLNGLRRCWKDTDTLQSKQYQSGLFRKYLGTYLSVLAGAVESSNKSKSNELVSDVLNACLLKIQLEKEAATLSETEIASLVQYLNTCATHLKLVDATVFLDAIMKLSSVPSQHTYNTVCIPSINRLCDEYAAVHEVSKLRILMEVAVHPEASEMAASRLVSLASDCIANEEKKSSLSEVIVFMFALLGHSEQKVRKAALELMEVARGVMSRSGTGTDNDNILDDLFSTTAETSKATSQILMGGSSALPTFLAGLFSTSDEAQKRTNELLKLSFRTACSEYSRSDEDKRWLTFEDGQGGCTAATIVLKALELSGEASAPLMQRYNHAGRDILNVLLEDGTEVIPDSAINLFHCVTRMMKGVIVEDSSTVGNDMIISTGPSRRGTRTRSYSVGRSPGVSFIEPYPKVMRDDVLNILLYKEDDSEMKKELCRAVVHDVLGSPSWGQGVFKNMDKGSRKKLSESLLNLWKSELIDGAGDVFLGLELNGKDVADLIRGEGKKTDLSSTIFLSDYVHVHTERLRASPGYIDLVSLLFQTLEAISSNDYADEEEDEVEFARHSLLRVIGGLVPCEDTTTAKKQQSKFPKKDLMKWATLLVALIGGPAKGKKSKQMRALPFGRPKSLSFSLLTSLCSYDPASIAAMLVPAMLDSITLCPNSESTARPSNIGYRLSHDVFLSVVPVFFKYADAAGLSQFDLYNQVLAKAAELEDGKRRTELYSCMVDAIMEVPSEDWGNTSPLGSFCSAVIAFDVSSNEPSEMAYAAETASEILRLCSPMAQVSSLTQMVGHAYNLLSKISGDTQTNDQRSVSMEGSTDELETAILFASKPKEVDQRVFRLKSAVAILTVVSNSLATTPVMNVVMKGDEAASKLSLNLWQDLLLLQSAALQENPEEKSEENAERRLWDECEQLVDSSLEQLQSLLPAHLFLASAALLIEDGEDTELCSRAIGLVSERAAETDSESPEASLFLDMLPMLTGLLNSSPDSMTDANAEACMLVQQSVFVAVEIFARALCLKSSKDHRERLKVFTDVLKHASDLIKVHATPFEQQDQIISEVDSPSCQVLCSAALCVSTLVRLLTVRSIPLLPDLVGSLISVLCSVNQALVGDSDQWNTVRKNHAAVLQISILRPLLAIAGSLPQFLGPYIDRLLSPSALLSPSLRLDGTEQQVAVGALASQLGVTLSKKIPARQLIPSLCKSLPKCTRHTELQSLLAMLKESVQQAPRSEVSTLRNWLLKAFTVAYEFRGEDDGSGTTNLVTEANDVLLALVLKLSEAQLRPLYAKLREWRGDPESETNSSDLVVKRHAFWSMSASLSSQLRSIFLPCLSTVVSDAVKELELAASQLRDSNKKKIDDGRKRQRLETVDDADSCSFLKPLLSCLESALHADAAEGGKWVRHDDSQRYHSLLPPLSKLLELRSISNGPESTYEQIVHETESETGSVIGCLTALASAAGNEQLWKPLNHAVLEACGNESRVEVRKGGVACLLSLIKALGEEYMVLLPECLPVLSELLEETDEDIAGMAQECVTIGEDLLGESLQDSLR